MSSGEQLTDIRPAYMAHVVLRTADRARLVDWYQTVLGCEVVHADHRITFLSFDEEHHRLGIVQNDALQPADADRVGVAHFAFSYSSFGDLLKTYERLKAAGIDPYWSVNHRMSTSFYYRDPDGNQIEIQTDNPGSEAELKAAFVDRTVDIDGDVLLAKWKAGASDAELAMEGVETVPA